MRYNLTETNHCSVASITDQHLKTVVAYISADIHEHKTAQSHATELVYADMLLSGAGKYTRAQFLDVLNGLGATITPSVSEGVFTLFIKTRHDVATKTLALIETMLLSPHFNASELSRTKQTVINAVRESKENATAIAHEQLKNTLYGQEDRRYTYDEDTLIDAVKKVTVKDLKGLHTRVLTQPSTSTIAASETVVADFKKTVLKIRKSSPVTRIAVGVHQQLPPKARLVLREIASKQNIEFSIGTPVPITLHHPDFLPLVFGLLVLGGPLFASRLMSTVREKEGLTYGIYADGRTFLNEEQGYVRIGTFFSPEKAVQGLASTFREVRTLFKKGITHTELEQFKIIYVTKQTLIGDSLSRQTSDLHSYHLQNFSLEEIAAHKARIKSLTLTQVNEAIAQYLNPTNFTISAAGPIKAVKKDLEAFMKTMS